MEKIKSYFSELESFNWALFISLCFWALVPAVYQTIRTCLISTTVSTSAFDVIGQMEWFDLINETLLAFLIIPLYSILNKIYTDYENRFASAVLKVGVISFLIYFAFSAIIFIYGINLIKLMNPKEIDINLVNSYLQLETIAFMLGIVSRFVTVVFVVIGKTRNVYIFLTVNVLLNMSADFVLIPAFGVIGVAVSTILINLILGIVGVWVLRSQKYIKIEKFSRQDLGICKEWARVGAFSGFQQFIDNIFYALMIGKMVNMVSEQGNYWIANNFIWGWLLIPVTALTEIIRTDCKKDYRKLRQSNYYIVTLLIVIVWTVTIPLWNTFYRYAEQLTNYREIFSITVKLFPFYIAYAFCVIPDNIFIGFENTQYNMINSLIINLGYYGSFFILYITKTVTMSMNVIILMFGFGMVIHLIISIIEERIFLKGNI